MPFRTRIGLVVIVVLVAIGVWASAQVRQQQRVEPPIVLSGSDIGFRVESRDGKTPVGKLVVRVDGQWVEVQFGSGVRTLGTR